MQQEVFEVTRERFHLLNKNLYILQGSFPKECEAEAWLDDKKLEVSVEPWENNSVLVRTKEIDLKQGEDITITVHLPDSMSSAKQLKIYAVSPAKKIKWFTVPVKDLEKRRGKPYYYIEEEKVDTANHSVQVRGWVVFDKPVEIGRASCRERV